MRGMAEPTSAWRLPLGLLSATMQKSVDNTSPNTLVPEPRRGADLRRRGLPGTRSPTESVWWPGYRLPFSSGVYFVDAAVDVATLGGGVEAEFPGVGISPERKQLGESWPDRWNLDPETGYGATLRLGGSPGGLQSRGHQPAPRRRSPLCRCAVHQPLRRLFHDGTLRSLPVRGGRGSPATWTSRAGRPASDWKKTLSQRVTLRFEAVYAVYAREEWTTEFEDVAVTVRSSMKVSAAGLGLGLILRP